MNDTDTYKIGINESRLYTKLVFGLIGITGMSSLIFIYSLIFGSKFPIDIKLFYYIEILTWKYYLLGIASLFATYGSIMLLGINFYKNAKLRITKDSLIISSQKRRIQINDKILLKLEVSLKQKNDSSQRVVLITNNYVRRYFLKIPREVMKMLEASRYKSKITIEKDNNAT